MTNRSGNSHRVSNALQHDLHAVKGAVVSLAGTVKKQSQRQSNNAIAQAKKHPAVALGIAAGVGLLLGLFLRK